MRVTISARQCEIADHLRDRARVLMDRLAKTAPRIHSGRVTFAEDHGEMVVELQLRAARGVVHVAHGAGPDHRSALDRAAQRMRRQAGRVPAKRRARQRQPR